MTHAAEIGKRRASNSELAWGGKAVKHTTLTTKCQFISHETSANANKEQESSRPAEESLPSQDTSRGWVKKRGARDGDTRQKLWTSFDFQFCKWGAGDMCKVCDNRTRTQDAGQGAHRYVKGSSLWLYVSVCRVCLRVRVCCLQVNWFMLMILVRKFSFNTFAWQDTEQDWLSVLSCVRESESVFVWV